MSFTVTMTNTGGLVNNGIALQVVVLTGASGTVGRTASQANNGATLSVTPLATGSLVYGIFQYYNTSNTPSPQAGTTFETGSPWHLSGIAPGWAGRSSAATVAGTPVTLGGGNLFTNSSAVLCEVEAAGTLAEDASSPALAVSTSSASVTTASFSPPSSTLLVALASAESPGSGFTTMTVTDTSGLGLTWTQQAAVPGSGGIFAAGIWTAPVPASGTTATAGLAAATGSAGSLAAQVGAAASSILASALAYSPLSQLTALPALAAATGRAYTPAFIIPVVQGQSRATVGEAAGSSASVGSIYGSQATVT